MFNTKTFATLGFAFIASIVSAACGGASDEAGGGDTGDEQDVTLLKHCGGFAGLTCTASTTTCVDDPSDSCDPEAGGRDCGGVCINVKTAKKCGGFAGFTCATGSLCVDDPTDTCNPSSGGADCMGVCVKAKAPVQTCASVRCTSETHCEMKGINGGAIPVCISNAPVPSPQSCASVRCASGTHCEMKGINGGAIPVCIRN